MKRIVFASENQGKIKEVKEILAAEGYEVLAMSEAGIRVDIEENGESFRENAYIKAKAVWDLCKGIVMADDSGLMIDYLNGEPGVYSARYLGKDSSYAFKNREIIRLMEGADKEERSARFRADICCILEDGSVLHTTADMEGLIAKEPAGEGGFGYDPILYLPELGKTSAELSAEQKNEISHRGKALRLMREELRKSGEQKK
ncbi:MAG: RdgB/HAM1 family non-canonical purine NTP pyrophosphatase [Johnsonella sp.]|nr:RdgB/HAM1 family non-canonical purine NTP pyrophosphatase [Johnsonella sp.]